MRATGSVTGANPPTISLSGALFANRETPLNGDASYALAVDARDGSAGASSQGVKSIEVLLDDERADYVEQTCPAGSCALARTYTLRTDDYAQGVHVVTVKVTDLGGAVRTQTFTINVDHSDSEDPFNAPAGAAGKADEGPLLADDPTNPPDEGNGSIAQGLTCSGGDTIVEKHKVTSGASFASAQAAFTAYMAQPNNADTPASAFTQTGNEPTKVTYTARQGANAVGIVIVNADSSGKWAVEGQAACGAFAGEPRPPAAATAAATGCPTPSAAAQQFYTSVYCRAFQDVDFYFSASFPTGRRRDRVVEGARAWNAAPGPLFYRAHRGVSIPAGGTECARTVPGDAEPVGVVSWAEMDGRAGDDLAEAGTCNLTDTTGKVKQAYAFIMRFDKDERWYYRSKKGKPKSNQIDMRSVATHEMGHATGWGPHFDDKKSKSYCANNERQQTMCATYYVGSVYQRNLGARDVKIFRGAYGP